MDGDGPVSSSSAGGHGLMHCLLKHFLKPAGQFLGKIPRPHALAEIQGIFDSRVVGQARILSHINIKIVAFQILW